MATKQEITGRSELHRRVVDNYIGCLKLPLHSQVLIITDNPPPADEVIPFDLGVRRAMATSLVRQFNDNGHRTVLLEVSPFMDKKGMLYPMTYTALLQLEGMPKNGGDRSTTVVCLTDNLMDASGVYAAASSFSRYSTTRFASSMGFGIGDYLFMSQLDERRKKALKDQSNGLNLYFGEHSAGEIEIQTQDSGKHDLKLSLKYNTHQAPMTTDLGQLGTDSTPKAAGMDLQYAKIPGGEMYAAPFPFNVVNGRFSSHRFIFDIHHGFLVNISADQNSSTAYLSAAQQNLMSLVQHGKTIPISQFGFGLHDLSGIRTQNNSKLARRKSDLFIGFGQPESQTPESGIINRTAGTLHHVDFVLDSPSAEIRSISGQKVNYPAKT